MFQKKPHPPNDVLFEAYQTHNLAEVGKLFGVSKQTVMRWMEFAGLPRRPREKPLRLCSPRSAGGAYRDKAWLTEQYVTRCKSLSAICSEYGCTPHTIWIWLHRHGIPRRTLKESARISVSSGRYASGHKHRWFKGGRFVTATGYVKSRAIGERAYRFEHRVAMEKHLGRQLRKDEIVHHINGNKQDNRIENLRLLAPSQHSPTLHVQEQLDEAKTEIARLRALLGGKLE